MDRQKEKAILEAVLFTMGESVEVERLAAVIEEDKKTTRELLLEMKEEYDTTECGVTLLELDDSFQMCTKAEMYEYLIKIAKTPRKYVLTDTLLETLSIVAYK
ncbi:MAG: SMC-Scp complex subunit ScpB, partial [Lachnospiraceae bacterium]|nr:SMC-Scp complex subunit ScpB [Lachnospiraceae bacterium]